ncbi:Mannosyl-D-glycerate transport/metabolism system repressor MngR [Aquimixticola soesokkakensis]|uniref:Mannosyl-D-glycerate transport/metabolism system repressor MngR n=1 Tax=Aquimixticola soesokkakensis TaxID=1519096 RepID=A0A1Y5TC85_9RHOB|nr:GntR family transcriptional regulator [Aquimixticola soesokkakensis]SLN57113.1 Mannosyl-D-glycerate transport/metabolism system repressor MngR [Aquimixticola soesokkakensis]
MTLTRDDASPLYLQVTHLIEKEISSGTYPVGSLLPPEADLAVQLGVSRHTIRQAIAQMRARGQLSARKGVGTRVESQREDWSTRFTCGSRDALYDFARETELHFACRKTIEARGALAAEIGCRTGHKFYHLAGLRYVSGNSTPMCWNEVYLEPRLKPVIEGVDILRSSLFTLIEQHTGERIREIRQDLRAVAMPDHIAPELGCATGAICMKMSRRYIGSGGRLLEYAVQYNVAENFVYQTTISST